MKSPHNSQKQTCVSVHLCVCVCVCVCVYVVTNAQVIFQPHNSAYFWFINIPHVTSYSSGEK